MNSRKSKKIENFGLFAKFSFFNIFLAPEECWGSGIMDMVTIHWKSMDFNENQWKSLEFDDFQGFLIFYRLETLSHDASGGF